MSYKGQLNETPKGCKGCCFRHTASNASICAYSLYMGEPRGCPVEECSFYSAAPRGKKFRKEKLEKKLLACPCCGAPMKKEQTECSYCGSNFLIEKKVEKEMYDINLEADWIGKEPEEFEEREEYIPEYFPECECDYEF